MHASEIYLHGWRRLLMGTAVDPDIRAIKAGKSTYASMVTSAQQLFQDRNSETAYVNRGVPRPASPTLQGSTTS